MNTELIAPRPCPSCGQPLPSGVLEGLCPRCLLARGTETEDGSSPRPRFEAPPVETVAALFPQLEILGLLGAGGMGAVYRARQPALDRIVALKVLPADDSPESGSAAFAERFNREARALARLNHPNIVAVYEFGRAGHLHFFLMEFVDGANLRQLLKAQRLSPREALQIIPQVCDALQYAHDAGVVHRDIKPENVLLDRRGRVKIADFGLAKIRGTDAEATRLTAEGTVMGTPHYMAPEQLERPLAVDHRADIYSLGVVFYEMLTGDLPLGRFSPPSRKVEVDVRLDEVVLRALENDPNRRYQQAGEVKTRVETIVGAPGETAAEAGSPANAKDHANAGADSVVVPRPECRWSWAGFPLVFATHRQADRRVDWPVAAQATAVILGVLTVAFGLVTVLTGRSLFGVIGVIGWPSLLTRALISLGVVMWAIHQTRQRPDPDNVIPRRGAGGTVILAPPGSWWSRHWRGLGAITLYVALWVWFQSEWLMPQFARWAGAEAAVHLAARDPQTGVLTAPLPDGAQLELMGVTDPDAPVQGLAEWWRADGTTITNALMAVSPSSGPATLASDTMRRTIAWRTVNAPPDVVPAVFDFEPTVLPEAGLSYTDAGRSVPGSWAMSAVWPVSHPKAKLRFGYALGDWREVMHYRVSAPHELQPRASNDRTWFSLRSVLPELEPRGIPELLTHGEFRVSFGPESQALMGHLGATYTVAPGPRARNWRIRVVARNQDGVEQEATQVSQGGPEPQRSPWTFRFSDWAADQIRELRVEAQLLHWVEFPEVALRPPPQPAFKTTATRVVPTPAPAPGLLAEPPRVRFLAWQRKDNHGDPVWHYFLPHGAEASLADASLLSRLGPPTWIDLRATTEGKHNPPILHLWFSHPLLDARSWSRLELVDEDRKPMPLGAGGSMGASYVGSEQSQDGQSWLCASFSPENHGQVPERIQLHLRYSVGEPERVQEVPADFSGSMSLPNGGMLNGLGETPDGRAFLALAANSQEPSERQFIVRAQTTDGRSWESSGSQLTGPANGFLTARYEFAFPVAVTKKFLVGTRPIRSAFFKDLVLPPQTPPVTP